MKIQILESSILFILVLNIFRTYYLINQWLMVVIAVPLMLFMFFSLPNFSKTQNIEKFKIFLVGFIALLLFGFMLGNQINYRINHHDTAIIHDGIVQTEEATRFILEGRNPYQETYEKVLKGERFYHNGKPDPVLSAYVYSPLMFIINIPFQMITANLFNFSDMRVTLMFVLLIAAFVASLVTSHKALFLSLFLFNPLVIHGIVLGANDTLALFFLISSFTLLYFARVSLATVFITLSAGTKLTVVPILIVYFLYLFLRFQRKNQLKKMTKQIAIFSGVALLIYLPFAIWDFGSLISDLILFPIRGGEGGYPIVGFIGIPHLLATLGLISRWTDFPLYLFQLPIILVGLVVVYQLLKKSLEPQTFCFVGVLFFILVFTTTRVFQPNYLDFISAILIFAGFIKGKNS